MNEKIIERHAERLNELQEEMNTIVKDSIYPELSLTFAIVEKMANMFGYDNMGSFLIEDKTILSDKLENMNDQQKRDVKELCLKACIGILKGTYQAQKCEKLCDEAEIIKNVLNALTGSNDY